MVSQNHYELNIIKVLSETFCQTVYQQSMMKRFLDCDTSIRVSKNLESSLLDRDVSLIHNDLSCYTNVYISSEYKINSTQLNYRDIQ